MREGASKGGSGACRGAYGDARVILFTDGSQKAQRKSVARVLIAETEVPLMSRLDARGLFHRFFG